MSSLYTEPALLIEASAGSGKTHALVNRYISLLVRGEDPSKILATTFTRSAAGEIYERIIKKLLSASQDKDECKKLSEQIGIKFNVSEIQKVLTNLLSSQHRLRISTIDTLSSSLLRLFSPESGFNSNWQVAENYKLDLLHNSAFQKMLRKHSLEDLHEILKDSENEKNDKTVEKERRKAFEFYEKFRDSLPKSFGGWIDLPDALSNSEINELYNQIDTINIPLTKQNTPNQAWIKAIGKLRESLLAKNWKEILDSTIIQSSCKPDAKFNTKSIELKDCELFFRIGVTAAIELGKVKVRLTRKLGVLLQEFNSFLKLEEDIQGLLNFSEIKRRVKEIGETADISEYYYRLDSKIHHILLDEFQDTSLIDWQILSPFVEEILSKAGDTYSFFCVGDGKQSIYRWRGGIPELFSALKEYWTNIKTAQLAKSYRLSKTVTEFVNLVFKDINNLSCLASTPYAVEQFQSFFTSHIPTDNAETGYVSICTSNSVDRYDQEAETMKKSAALIADIHKKTPNASIGVLSRDNRFISRLTEYLKEVGLSSQISQQGKSPTSSSQAVQIVLSLFRCIDHPGDTIAKYHVANSLLGKYLSFTDWEDVESFSNMRKNILKDIQLNGIGSVSHTLIQKLTNNSNRSEGDVIQQFVSLSYEYPESKPARLSDFINYILSTELTRPTEGLIQLMTIHRSKGLEFDVVVLPDLDSKYHSNRSDLYAKSTNPFDLYDKVLLSFSEKISNFLPQFDELKKHHHEQETLDSLCGLYVAITRAKKALYCVISPNGSNDTQRSSTIITESLNISNEEGDKIIWEMGEKSWYLNFNDKNKKMDNSISFKEFDLSSLKKLKNINKIIQRKTASQTNKENSIILKPRLFSAEALISSSLKANKGTLVHLIASKLDWLSLPVLPELSIEGSKTADIKSAKEFFSKSLEYGEVFSIFTKERYQSHNLELYRELPFLLHQENSIISGAIDRLVIYEDKNARQIEIIDFKTDQVVDQEINDVCSRYVEQLSIYKKAASKRFNVPEDCIRCMLAFLSIGKVIRV